MSSAKPEPSKTATSDFLLYERMLISWVRTSLSLISFGFTIYKFFQYLVDSKGAQAELQRGPRNLGISLVAVGTLVLLAATFQYWKMQRRLRRETGAKLPLSLGLVTALSVSAIGLVALAELIFRFGPF